MVWLAGTLSLLLAAIHAAAWRLRSLGVAPRSRWLSAGSGVSVAYVFVHILPDLAESQRTLRATAGGVLPYAEHHVYVLAMLGLMTFYGLERLAKQSKSGALVTGGATGVKSEEATGPGVFWVHIGSFAVYNALIGYLLSHRERPGLTSLLFFFLAMATHFLVNDHGLRQDHKGRYDRYGRWLLSAAVVSGWALGATVEVHPAVVAVLFSLLAGGVILNVLKEELPQERQSNFWAFAAGSVTYSTLLLAM
jgi:hypothetical protein